MLKTVSCVLASVCHLEVYGGQRWEPPPKWPNNVCPCLVWQCWFFSWWGSGQGAVSWGVLVLRSVCSAQRLWDACEAALFTCIYLFAGIKLQSTSLYPRPPLLFLDSLQKYLKAFIVSSPLPTIYLERC